MSSSRARHAILAMLVSEAFINLLPACKKQSCVAAAVWTVSPTNITHYVAGDDIAAIRGDGRRSKGRVWREKSMRREEFEKRSMRRVRQRELFLRFAARLQPVYHSTIQDTPLNERLAAIRLAQVAVT